MRTGELIAERFRVGEQVGAGGMGTVYRATEEPSGRVVAIKAIRSDVKDAVARFGRESTALARLDHPSVVRYVSHGSTDHGPYLVMEWLAGEDLAARLKRAGLTLDETLLVAKQTCAALAAAHAVGVVHRDIKPANLFFEAGRIDRLKVVDFGLARLAVADEFVSVSGFLVGTPGYMAPEQARADREIDGAVDVFALGCVLYKCVTGHAPFAAQDAVATLAKILFEDPKPIAEVRRGVPAELAAVIEDMLAKDKDARPTASALIERLRTIELGDAANVAVPAAMPSMPALTNREQRVVSVVIAAPGSTGDAEVTVERAPRSGFLNQADELRRIGEGLGARVEFLGDAVVATLFGKGGATDQAARAARLSIELHRVLPELPVAVATGRAEVGKRVVGEVIDRAWELLDTMQPSVRVDELTAGLLGSAQFEVRDSGGKLVLVRERDKQLNVRTLLGKPTPCVGRDRELGALDALYEESATEPMARAVIVQASAGLGKSRLRYEWLATLSNKEDPPRVFMSRAASVAASAPYFTASQWVRDAAKLGTSDAGIDALERHLASVVPAGELSRVLEFLAEMLALSNPATPGAQLRAARLDPLLMADQVQRACVDWLAAELTRGPVVLVLEDLHWGDAPSVKVVDVALRRLERSPLLVAAFARPEVETAFPSLWSARAVETMRLGELTPKAAAKLVRAALGDDTPQQVVDRITAHATGNAFFLEEMIRAHANGNSEEAPATVRAVVQRRLEGLDPDARRVLRAAAVFGPSFWEAGALALLGGESNPVTRVGDWLGRLVEQELVSRRSESRLKGQAELVFRHAIVRDAAYDMLTDDDRKLGHLLAGDWLHRHGERDAVVLARHFELGKDERAIGHYLQAATQALEAGDFAAVESLGEHAVTCGAAGERLGEARRLQSEAARWGGRIADAESRAVEAVRLLVAGSTGWYSAIGELITLAGNRGHSALLQDALSKLVNVPPLDHGPARAIAHARTAVQLFLLGRRDEGNDLLARLKDIDTNDHPLAHARVLQALSYRALSGGEFGEYYTLVRQIRDLHESTGDRRNACVQTSNLAYSTLFFGAHEEAEALIAEVHATASVLGLARMVAFADQKLGQLRFEQGRIDESIEIQTRALGQLLAYGDARLATSSHVSLAWSLDAKGDTKAAFEHAEAARVQGAGLQGALTVAEATIADLELRHGSLERGKALAASAAATLLKLGGVEHGITLVRIVQAESLAAFGERERALQLITDEVARIQRQAERAPRPEWSGWVHERVVHHRRARALAKRLEQAQ